jgi:hypothetical protein
MKFTYNIRLFQSVLLVLLFCTCKEKYLPAVLKTNAGYLVVEGSIVSGDSTIIRLSRTSNISDTLAPNPEPGDKVVVAGQDNSLYPLTDRGNGYYYCAPLNLSTAVKYRLQITTSGGANYQSDYVPLKLSPPIDSVGWYQDTANNVQLYVNSHNTADTVGYYRWDYDETWKYHSSYSSGFDWVNGQVVVRNLADYVYNCWSVSHSSNVIIASTAKLAQDVIYQQPVATVPYSNERLWLEYSILVRQYSLTQDAYNFWQNLKTSTQQLGSLFDAQPAQLQGNIHNVSNPGEVVVGYISACSVQTRRIFINANDVKWQYLPYYDSLDCSTMSVRPDSMSYYFPPSGPYKWVVEGTLPFSPNYIIVPAECADCRVHGGTNVKPSYWP